MTTSESRALGDWFDGLGRWPSTLYVTHGHADHFFGATPLLARRPQLRLVAPRGRPRRGAAGRGGAPPLLAIRVPRPAQRRARPPSGPGRGRGAARRARPGRRRRPRRRRALERGARPRSRPRRRRRRRLQRHPPLAGRTTPSSRAAWLEALDGVEKLGASTIVAGHKDAAAPDDDAHRTLDATREYLADFDRAAASSGSPAELFTQVMGTHPDLGNPYTLWVAAHDQPGS